MPKDKPFPIRHINVSGGYDLNTQFEADEESLLKMFQDRLKSRANQSIVLPRSISDGIDDNKFMYSLLPGLPVAMFGLRNAMLPWTSSSALGSADISKVVESLNATKASTLEDLQFVNERKLGSSIDQNWADLFASQDNPKGAANLFTCLDIPFAYNLYSRMFDPDVKKFDVIVDFNTKKALRDLFNRNFYDYLVDGKEIKAWKEPNSYTFTQDGLDAVLPIISKFYSNRRGGNQLTGFLRLATQQLTKHPTYIKRFYKAARYLISRRPDTAVSSEDASLFATAMVSDLFDEVKVQIKGRHTDPFQVRDMDSLKDMAFYRAICEEIAYSGGSFDIRNLYHIYPHAENLAAAAEELASQKIPIIDNFDSYLNSKVERMNSYLSDFGEQFSEGLERLRNEKYSGVTDDVWDNAIKDMKSYRIPVPIINGKVNHALIDEDENLVQEQIHKTINFIMQSQSKQFPGYLAQFNKDQAEYYTLIS